MNAPSIAVFFDADGVYQGTCEILIGGWGLSPDPEIDAVTFAVLRDVDFIPGFEAKAPSPEEIVARNPKPISPIVNEANPDLSS